MANDIKDKILAFYERIACDPNHRYRSWEHCFLYFFKHRPSLTGTEPIDIDTAALHLAFYLASWGMYRGSSPLLWKDYKIHIPAVRILFDRTYSPLRDISRNDLLDVHCNDAAQINSIIPLILQLSDDLRKMYSQQITSIKFQRVSYNPSHTLITKTLLGTIACTPACDRYFILGWRRVGLTYTQFDDKFLCQVFQFYQKHHVQFDQAQAEILKHSGIKYPIMKLVDMYFWELGFDPKFTTLVNVLP